MLHKGEKLPDIQVHNMHTFSEPFPCGDHFDSNPAICGRREAHCIQQKVWKHLLQPNLIPK